MTDMTHRAAWLAGFLDGEGSIGVTVEFKPERAEGRQFYIQSAVQMSTTDKASLDAALAVLRELGVTGAGYTYQERDPTKHRDAWYLRLPRQADQLILAATMIPYAVTKRRQWELLHAYVASRQNGMGTTRLANVRNPYTDAELELVKELHAANWRGPNNPGKEALWQSKLDAIKAGRPLRKRLKPLEG